MKPNILSAPRLICLSLFVFVTFAVGAGTARAQEYKLQINLDHLAPKAAKVIDVNIDGALLQLARSFLSDKKPNEARAKEVIAGLKGIYVKSFEFDREGGYSLGDVEAIRTQLRTPQWSRIVGIVSKNEGDNVEVYTRIEGTQIIGLAVVSAEPKELTVVNIVGPIDISKLRDLEGNFGIPGLDIKIGNGIRIGSDKKTAEENRPAASTEVQKP